MKKNKPYKVTAWKILASLFNSAVTIPFTSIGLYFIGRGMVHENIIGFGFLFLLCLTVWFGLGVYPAYLCWIYYKHDKNKKIHIDYENSELHYIIDDEINKVIKFDDIIRIKKFHRFFIGLWYYRLVSRHEETLIITSLLIDSIPKALPGIRDREDTINLLLPKSKENNNTKNTPN